MTERGTRTPKQIRFSEKEREMLAYISARADVSDSEMVRYLIRERYEREVKKEKSPPK